MLKIGDRVRCILRQYGDELYKVGTIVFIEKGFLPFLVEYDVNVNGHDGNLGSKFRGKYGHCIWHKENDLELIK